MLTELWRNAYGSFFSKKLQLVGLSEHQIGDYTQTSPSRPPKGLFVLVDSTRRVGLGPGVSVRMEFLFLHGGILCPPSQHQDFSF